MKISFIINFREAVLKVWAASLLFYPLKVKDFAQQGNINIPVIF